MLLLARLWHDAARRRARARRSAMRASGHPLVERANATIATVAQLFREHWPTSAAVYLPGGNVPATGSLFANTRAGARPIARILARGRERGRRPRGADRAARADVVAGLRRRGDRPLLPHPGRDGFAAATPPSRRAHRRRHGALAAARRGAAHLRLWPLHGAARAGHGARARWCCSSSRCSRASTSTASIRPSAGFHPPRGRVLQARLCGPRDVLRRSRFRRRADARAPLGRLQRRAPQARRRARLARAAAGQHRRAMASASRSGVADGQRVGAPGAGEPTVGAASPGRTTTRTTRALSRAGDAGARAAWARRAATPCISTSSTRPATWCRRRRRAAGCNPRR